MASTVTSLHDVLQNLLTHQFPTVECPPHLNKRASIALILRVNPAYPDKTEQATRDNVFKSDNASERLKAFFSQGWVSRGEPEALFIKRAARKGDRWQGHVALPGGRRDPEDADDQATAVRETAEEVGIDLGEGKAIYVGNLPQRLVTTSWGKVLNMRSLMMKVIAETKTRSH